MSRAPQSACLLPAAGVTFSGPATASTAEHANAVAERAVTLVVEVGRDRVFADPGRPDGGFTDGRLHVFFQDASGVAAALWGNAGIADKHLNEVRDPDGRYPNVELSRMGLDNDGHQSYRAKYRVHRQERRPLRAMSAA